MTPVDTDKLLLVSEADGKGYEETFATESWEQGMTQDAKEEPPKTLSIPEAGWRYYRLGRNASYEAVKRGYIPIIKTGTRKMRVPVIGMERILSEAGRNKANALDPEVE